MAESSKRNSIAGKVATPKTAGIPATTTQPMVDQLEALGKALGARIKLTTAAPHSQSYEGTLFTACPIMNVVAMNTRNPPPSSPTDTSTQPGDYHIIPVSRIQSFQVVSLAATTEEGGNSFASAQPAIGPVDTKRLKEREQARTSKLKEDEQSKGKGVTKEGQAIFDSMKRVNVELRWHNQEMIAYDAVIISPPYRPEDCKGSKDKQETLNRVKKVLEGERRKLREKEERDRKAATPLGPRKGG